MTSMTPEGKLMQARIVLRNEAAYIGDLLIYLQPEFCEFVPTMGVDHSGKLFVNRAWVEKLSAKNVTAVVVHEVLHVALMHPFRDPPEVMAAKTSGQVTGELAHKHHLFNCAIDLKVNFMMHEIGRADDLPQTELMPTRWGSWSAKSMPGMPSLTIDGIGEKSAERIYKELLEHDEKCQQQRQYQQVDDHTLWVMAGSGDGDGEGEDGDGDSDGGGKDGKGKGKRPKMSAATAREAAGDWMVRVAGALNTHKGDMPAGLKRALENMLTPKIDWRDRLQRFVQPIVATDTSYRRPRRTSWVTGIIMPGPQREGVKLIAHIDTSGSMQKPELEQIAGELYGILDAYPHVEMTLLYSDANYPEAMELRSTEKDQMISTIGPLLTGGGGTSHRPVVEWMLKENEDAIEALLCFTDGDSDIQHCFNDLAGIVSRMLLLTRDYNMDKLAPFCEEAVHLPC